MQAVKYEHLEEELVNLQPVLRQSLQSDFLQIKRLITDSLKFKEASKRCKLKNAEYVIYSSYMPKKLHHCEIFVFIDKTGKMVCSVPGRELTLYNMIENCDNEFNDSK